MILHGIPKHDLEQIVSIVSEQRYGRNLILDHADEKGKDRVDFTLRTKDSSRPGSRLTREGRHMPKACWHAHYDVMSALFNFQPNARLQSQMADYRGQLEFLQKAPATGQQNIGSQAEPMLAVYACECGRR